MLNFGAIINLSELINVIPNGFHHIAHRQQTNF